MVMYSRTFDILCCHLRGPLHVYIITTWLLAHHPHDSDPWGETLAHGSHHGAIRTLISRFPSIWWCMRQGILWKEEIFSLKAIFSSWSNQHDSFPCTFGEVPPRLAEKRKKLKLHCCIGFNNVPVFWDHSYKIFIFSMSTYGTYAGRAAYPDNAGQNTHFHCDHIHNDDYLWHLSTDQESFAKWSSGI